MAVDLVPLRGEALRARLDDIAGLRCAVFRDWPYLYDGDEAYERAYLASLASGDGLAVLALDGERAVGVSTAMPLAEAQSEFAGVKLRADEWYYLAESVLLPDYRGQGVGVRFFEAREDAAREAGFACACFCAVQRPDDHPARPPDHQPLNDFWRRRGYAPMEGVTATFAWREIGAERETDHTMQFWGKTI